jgi:predicted HTH domain antitoxin
MALVIEDSELERVHMSEQELRLEIAIMLYQKNKISAGRAGKMSGISRMEFLEELGNRKIPVNYDEIEFQKDLNTLGMVRL